MNIRKKFEVYALLDPENQEVRYVGITSSGIKARYAQHKNASLKLQKGTRVCKWFKSIFDKGLTPELKLLEECDESNWEEREIHWINQYKNLTNQLPGGKGVFIDRLSTSIERSANAHKKAIVQLTSDFKLIKIWPSITEATKALGLKSKGSILNSIKNKQFCKDSIWILEKDYQKGNFDSTPRKTCKTKVYQYTENKIFIREWESVTQAAKESLGTSYVSRIYNAIANGNKSGGFYWSFEKL